MTPAGMEYGVSVPNGILQVLLSPIQRLNSVTVRSQKYCHGLIAKARRTKLKKTAAFVSILTEKSDRLEVHGVGYIGKKGNRRSDNSWKTDRA